MRYPWVKGILLALLLAAPSSAQMSGGFVTVNDYTPPHLVQARTEEDSLVFEWDDDVRIDFLESALAQGHVTLSINGKKRSLRIQGDGGFMRERRSQPDAAVLGIELVETLDLNGQRLVLALPKPATGDKIHVVFGPDSVGDSFQNTNPTPITVSITWPSIDRVLLDTTPPVLEKLVVLDGMVKAIFSEPVDIASAERSILVNGARMHWQRCASNYGLCSRERLGEGQHKFEIMPGLRDLTGKEYQPPAQN